MKKVKSTKLKLNKETLTNLQLGSIQGGKTHGQKCKSALDACPTQRGCMHITFYTMASC